MSPRTLGFALLFVAGCEGSVVGGTTLMPGTGPQLPGGPTTQQPDPGSEPLPGPRFQCTKPLARGTTFGKLHRLTRLELTHTLEDLLGPAIVRDPAIAQGLAGLPSDELESLSTVTDAVPPTLGATLAAISRRAVTLLLASPTERAQRLGACSTVAPLTTACVRDVISTFGARVWRRPLDSAEVDALAAFYTSSGGGDAGLAFTLRRLLQSPSLVFHLEDRGADQGDRIRLTQFELASRISYATTASMPDEALLSAARAGELGSLEQLRPHVARLLDTPRGHERVRDFFRYYMHLGAVADPFKPAATAHGLDATGFGAELSGEALDFSESVFWNPTSGTFADLMTAKHAAPKTPRVARLFGSTCLAQATQSIAPDDASVFFHPDGSARGPAPVPLTASGWFVWQLPAGSVAQQSTRLEIELVAAASDNVPLELQVNLDDVPLTAFSAMPGTRLISAPVTIAAGSAAKVGLYYRNAAAGRSLTVKALRFLGPPPAGAECGQRVTADRHPGLLHRPALLAGPMDRTSPILRGAHVRKRFLCTDLPTPDPALVSARQTEVGSLEGKTNRERVTLLTGAAQCSGCHGLINPLGFSFEGFDQLGAPRPAEQLWDAMGQPSGTLPIDTRVEKPKLDSTGGPAVLTDSNELVAAMAASPTAAACFTQRAFEYYRVSAIDPVADGCALANAEEKAKTGSLRDVVIELIATDDLFYRGTP